MGFVRANCQSSKICLWSKKDVEDTTKLGELALKLGTVTVWIIMVEESLQTRQFMSMLGDANSNIGSCLFV